MADQIMRYLTITIIAFMVWLYAEGATRKSHSVQITVHFVAPPNQRLLIDPPNMQVSSMVRCATSQLQQVKELGADGIEIQLAEKPGEIEQLVSLETLVGPHERFNRLGVTIERVDPIAAPVRVERLIERAIPIELRMPPDLELAGPAVFSDVGQIVLPARFAPDIEGLKLVARLDGNALAGIVPGVTTDRVIDVSVPPEMARFPDLNHTPRKVKVTFTVKKKEDEHILGIVPVLLTIAPNLARQYDVKVDEESMVLRDIKIKGPSDMIARIKANTIKVEALLSLSPEELEKMIPSKHPVLHLPAGVNVESTPPLVKFTITKRPPPPN